MKGPQGQIQRLRLLLRAYEAGQPDAERRGAMGRAVARYLRAVGLRRGARDEAPIAAVEPIEPIDPLR